MSYSIDWKNLTEKEANEILNFICHQFNVLAKTFDDDNFLKDVRYLKTNGIYDDNFHNRNEKNKDKNKD